MSSSASKEHVPSGAPFSARETGIWHATGEGCPWARVIVFGWQDLAILNGPPVARRSFIDGFAARLFSSHVPALLKYRRLIEQRNRLLQVRAPIDRLAPWDEQLAAAGMELIDRRRRAVAALQTEIARVYPAVAGERLKVQVTYRSAIGEATEPAALVAALERARAEEMRRGLTVVGPHRDDLAIELDGIGCANVRLAGPATAAGPRAAARRGAAGDRGGRHRAGAAAGRRALGAGSGRAQQRAARDPECRAGIPDLAGAAHRERCGPLGR